MSLIPGFSRRLVLWGLPWLLMRALLVARANDRPNLLFVGEAADPKRKQCGVTASCCWLRAGSGTSGQH